MEPQRKCRRSVCPHRSLSHPRAFGSILPDCRIPRGILLELRYVVHHLAGDIAGLSIFADVDVLDPLVCAEALQAFDQYFSALACLFQDLLQRTGGVSPYRRNCFVNVGRPPEWRGGRKHARRGGARSLSPGGALLVVVFPIL